MTGDARESFLAPPAPVVIDASFALEAVLDGGPSLDRLSAMANDRQVRLVPPLFWVEAANVLLRRRRFEPGRAALTLAAMARAGIESADRGIAGLADALELAARHDLSVYDAVYLQLAIDVDGELATLDQVLARAASAEGVDVIAIG